MLCCSFYVLFQQLVNNASELSYFLIFFFLSCLADSGLIDQPFWEKSVQVPFFFFFPFFLSSF